MKGGRLHFDYETLGASMVLPCCRQIGSQSSADPRVGADVGVMRVGGEKVGDESFEFKSAQVVGFEVGHGQPLVPVHRSSRR